MQFAAGDPALLTVVGEKSSELIRLRSGPGCGLFGPYVNLRAGRYAVRVRFAGLARGQALIEFTGECGSVAIASRLFDLGNLKGQVAEIAVDLPRALSQCEVRLFCRGEVAADISAVEIDSISADAYAKLTAFEPYIYRNSRLGPYAYDMWITDPTAQLWYASADTNMPEKIWCLDHIREGMKVADCGAHHGQMTVVFSKAVGASGMVRAWEALPSNAAVVEKNLALNGCTNAIVRPVALGDKHEWVSLQLNDNNTTLVWDGPISTRDEGQRPDDTTQIVEVCRLDDELSPDFRLDFIKIDVEGSDLQMMRGATRTLAQRPIIDLEIHNFIFPDKVKTLTEIFGILAPLGYAYSILPQIYDVVQPVGSTIDLADLAQYINPHVFCLPIR